MASNPVDVTAASAIPLDEILDAVAEAGEEWQLEAAQISPCLALYWRDGAASERNNIAFNLALFLRHAGKDQSSVEALMTSYNRDKLGGHLQRSEIASLVRNAFKARYPRPPSCRHAVLKERCVGEDCYRWKAGVMWKAAPVSVYGAMASGIMACLHAREWLAFCSICELAKRKNRRPDSVIPFCYREIERVGGLPHQHQSKIWRQLETLGLILDFKPADKKGGHSTCRLPRRLPSPEEIKRARDQAS